MHKNKFNGKVYIGITSRDPKIRWNGGNGYWSNKHFYNAIKKYGWDDGFDHIILKDNLSQEEAEKMEIELIAKYDSANIENGYNINLGGHHNGQHSDATRKNI